MSTPARTDQALVSLTRARDLKVVGFFKELSGWGVDSNEAFTREGYGLERVALGGPKTRDTLSLSRTFYPDRDEAIITQLEDDCGAERYIVGRQVLLPDGSTVNTARGVTGMLKSCKQSDINVGDESPGAATYTVEVTPG